MIAVSEEFKTVIKKPGRQLKAYLDLNGDRITGDDFLKSIKISASGSLCKSVMRYAEAEYSGTNSYVNQYVHLGMGVVLPNDTIEYIDYGSFKVVPPTTYDKATSTTKIIMFDKMYESLQKYDLDPTFPMTLLEFLQAICARFNWTLATTSFPNDDLPISTDLFSNLNLTFREIIDDIAEASASIIFFNNNDELVVRNISTDILEVVDKNNLNTLKLEEVYGPITTVVLSREPQGDNIVQTI